MPCWVVFVPLSPSHSLSLSIVVFLTRHQEEAYLQEAIRQSLQDDDDKKPAAKTTATSNDLLDFGSTPSLPAPLPALVAATSVAAYGSSYGGAGGGGGGGPDPFAYSSTPSFPTHIPSTTTAPPNPYAGPATTAAADPWASMSMTSLPPAPVPTQGIDVSAAAATANGYHSSMSNLPPGGPMASSSIGYGTANTLALAHPPSQTASPWALPTGPTAPPQAYSAPTPVAPAPAASPWVPPPSISTSAQPSPYYNGTGVPLAVTPQAQPTPSTIGFLSPPSDFGGFADTPAPGHPNSAPPATSADPALFTMSALSNGGYPSSDQANPNAAEAGGSAADQAYAKLVNMDTFSLVSKTDAPRSNPFEFSSSMSNTIGGNRSLADIQSKKASVRLFYTPLSTAYLSATPALSRTAICVLLSLLLFACAVTVGTCQTSYEQSRASAGCHGGVGVAKRIVRVLVRHAGSPSHDATAILAGLWHGRGTTASDVVWNAAAAPR